MMFMVNYTLFSVFIDIMLALEDEVLECAAFSDEIGKTENTINSPKY